jgi:hypothetical protein
VRTHTLPPSSFLPRPADVASPVRIDDPSSISYSGCLLSASELAALTIVQPLPALLMQPLWLLFIFFMIAAAAFVWFWVLTYKVSTSRREDWKKFLSSFAGTALALSVGFASIMLQQSNQQQQRQSDELGQAQRKIAQENGQIRARLLYSITQKKFELQFFTSSELLSRNTEPICDPSLERAKRDELLRNLLPGNISDMQFTRELLERLFSTTAYERSPLNRLLTETGFAARVTPALSSDFLSNELELTVGGPRVISQLFELLEIDQREKLCDRLEVVYKFVSDVARTTMKTQLLSCAAYAIVELPKDEGVERSRRVVELVRGFSPAPADGRESSIKSFLAALESSVGSTGPQLKTCLGFAEVKLEEMP